MKLTKTHSRLAACALSLFVLPIAWAGDAEKKFHKMDANGDGMVSREEHSAGAQRMFTEMDADRDGILTVTELDAKKDEKHGDKRRDEMSSQEKIRTNDKNADGRLTAAEHAAGADAMFVRMDTNGDGSLSEDELKAGHKMKMKEKH